MATQSPTSPPAAGSDGQNPELSKPADGDGQLGNGEAANETSERPFLAPSEPMREDQVENAVKFLSHPKVRGSPVIYRRSFLEKKGLTKEEIDEAFRRVPDPPSNSTTVPTAATNQVAQPKPSPSLQHQAPIQSAQPAGVPVNTGVMVPSAQQARFHWSHALIAAGVLAASGAGTAVFFKNVVVPRLKTWIRKVAAEENESKKEDKTHSLLADQTAEAAKAAATAAAVVAKASEELLNSKNEERKYFEAFMNMMDVQVKEMKSMGEAIRKLETTRENGYSQDKMVEEYVRSSIGNGTTNNSWRTPQVNHSVASVSSIPNQVKENGTAAPEYAAVRPSSAPATVEPATAPHPKSYMEIMEMIQRGEKPSNIRDINDMPPNPDQQPNKPALAPRPKPWEVPQQKPTYSIPPPFQPPTEVPSSGNTENGLSSDANGKSYDSPEPWWKKKTVKITEIEPEAEDLRQQQFPSNAGGSRGWVPPQPPGVAIPEAAAAIRQSKSSVQKQLSSEVARSDDGEVGAGSSNDTRIEAEPSSSPFAESRKSEIEEEPVNGIEAN